MCLNDGAPVEPALCDQEAMPAADGKAKSFTLRFLLYVLVLLYVLFDFFPD